MTVFEYEDYKQSVNDWIKEQERGGHGQLRQLADHLGINSVVMSQVFRGDRDLTLEQALGVTSFMALGEMERDFFLLLVQKSRAGSVELKSVLEKQLTALKAAASSLKNRIKHQKLTDEDRATFYSQWYYSAVRLSTSVPELNSTGAIAEHLQLNRGLVSQVLRFLIESKLVIEKNGKLEMGPQVTHVAHDSPFVNRHHSNWRLKALQAMEFVNESNLFYTGPMALSEAAARSIQKSLLDLIQRSTKTAATSDSEVLRCLNIDWFEMSRR